MPSSSLVRVVAAIEAVKGCIVLAAGAGILSLIHRDLHELAAHLIAHAHLNPAAKYPSIFLDAASQVTDARILLLSLGAVAYSALRLLESYGLFHAKAWAEVLAAASGTIYVPIELYEVASEPTWLSLGALFLNLLIVAIMVKALQRRRSRQRNAA